MDRSIRCRRGWRKNSGIEIRVLDYSEHALTSGCRARAASYIHLMDVESGKVTYGVDIGSSITGILPWYLRCSERAVLPNKSRDSFR